MRLVLLTLATIVALTVAAPAGACAASASASASADDPCLNDPLAAIVTGDTWFEYTLDGVRDEEERIRFGVDARVWADYNRDGARQAGEAMVEIERDGSYTLPVDTRRLDGGTQVQVRFVYGSGRVDEFSPRCVAPSPGCVRTLDVTPRQRVTGIDFPGVAGATLRGRIWDDKNANGRREEGEDAVPFLNVFLDDNDNGARDTGEIAGYKTVEFGDGTYSIPVPPRYQEAGGALPPVVLERAPGVDCTAPADCTVRGLRTRTSGSVSVDHGVARPAVIFLHGYGGSQISCPGKLLWFGLRPRPDLMNMRLGIDGKGLTQGVGGTSCSENSFVDGLVMSVAGADIYGGASQHFKDIAWPGRAYDYVWDWRNSPEEAIDGLDALVEKARCGAAPPPCASYAVKRVQLVGHSMGGLVMRHYIDDPARAAKVERAVTVGTPYWGSPKPIFPVAAGTEVPFFSGMDLFLESDGLMAASRSFPGHFALMPSLSYGSWLTVNGQRLDVQGVKDYLTAIGADPDLYTRGLSEHGRVLDHFDDHGVDFQVVVGGGVPTMGAIALEHGIQDRAVVAWTDGDGTVPYHSAAHDTPRSRLHTVCGVSHVPLTTTRATTLLIDEFLIRGEEMRLASARCEWEARELSFYEVELAPLGRAAAASSREARVVSSGGRALSVAEAERSGLVDVLRLGGGTTIVAKEGADVRVELPAGVTATVRDLTPKGASGERRFGPVAAGTSVALGGSGAVTKGGKALKPVARDKRAPRTRAVVKRLRGGKVRLVLKARDAGSKVAATYVVVAGKRRVYRKPVVLTARRLARTTYGSVDIWGNTEKARKASS